ncbi:MAG: HU family DNA-binding protein [Halobacteriota archaeon]
MKSHNTLSSGLSRRAALRKGVAFSTVVGFGLVTGASQTVAADKAELVEAIASKSGLSKADAKRALDAILGTATAALVNDERVSVVGFGSFSVSKRAAKGETNRVHRSGDAVSEGPVVFTPADEFVAALDLIPGEGDARRTGRAGGPTDRAVDVTLDGALLARRSGLSKADAKRALDGFITATTSELKRNERVSLVGFGSFSISKRSARTGRNPQTGKEIKIPAKKEVTFKAGAELSGQVN